MWAKTGPDLQRGKDPPDTLKTHAGRVVGLCRYLSKELGRADLYSEKPICNKIDTVVKKGKRSYITNRKEKRAGNALKKTLH